MSVDDNTTRECDACGRRRTLDELDAVPHNSPLHQVHVQAGA